MLREYLRKYMAEKIMKYNPTNDSGKHGGPDFREMREPGSNQVFHCNSCQ